jgi:hypoxanthine phosphoribosyltransferase
MLKTHYSEIVKYKNWIKYKNKIKHDKKGEYENHINKNPSPYEERHCQTTVAASRTHNQRVSAVFIRSQLYAAVADAVCMNYHKDVAIALLRGGHVGPPPPRTAWPYMRI